MTKLLPLVLLVPLAGCISFGAKPPANLLVLTPTASVPVGQTQSSARGGTITVAVPTVSAELATQRVPVRTGNDVAYVKDADWTEPPNRLFARLMQDTIAATAGRVVLGTAAAYGDPAARLSGELRAFGIDAATNQAVVTFDAALIRGESSTIEKRRFEARVPVGRVDAASVAPALNQAANQVAGEVAAWVGR